MIKELIKIQSELKVPKSNYNDFGNYNYRSAEDILEAVKPLCEKHNCQLTLSDTVEAVGDRVYVCANATITNNDGDSLTVYGWAREAVNKKGMDDSQITGTASSYARKYALNGLFLIDDTKDADTNEYRQQNNTPSNGCIDKAQATSLVQFAESLGWQNAGEELCKYFGVERLSSVTVAQHDKFIEENK